MREGHEVLRSAGVEVIAVGGSAPDQAAALQPEYPFRLLLDPGHRVREAAGVGSLSTRQMMSPSSAWRYVRAFRGGNRPGRITRDAQQAPGVVLCDARLDVRWVHRGGGLGDYPEMDAVTTQIDRLR